MNPNPFIPIRAKSNLQFKRQYSATVDKSTGVKCGSRKNNRIYCRALFTMWYSPSLRSWMFLHCTSLRWYITSCSNRYGKTICSCELIFRARDFMSLINQNLCRTNLRKAFLTKQASLLAEISWLFFTTSPYYASFVQHADSLPWLRTQRSPSYWQKYIISKPALILQSGWASFCEAAESCLMKVFAFD